MDCSEARENLELLALDGLDPTVRADIEAHLAQCARCRAVANDCHELVHSIRSADRTRAGSTDGFVQVVRFATSVEIGFQHRQKRVRRAIGAAGSLAAAVVVAITVWSVMGEPSSDDRAGDSTATNRPERTVGRPAVPGAYGGSRSSALSEADGIAVVGQTVYLRRDEAKGANVAAIDATTGQSRWQGRFAVRGYLAADRHRVYCLADGSGGTLDLVALNAADGAELWRFARDRPRRMETPRRPVALDGRRVCWADSRTIYSLDAASGRIVWRRAVPSQGRLSGLVADETGLYVATAQALHCINRDRGTVLWTQPLPEHLAGRGKPLIALADGQAYVIQSGSTGTAHLLAIRLETRKVLWHRPVERTRSLLAAPQGAYLRGQAIVAFGRRRGEQLWARSAAGCGPLTLIDGRIYFVDMSDRGRLIALDSATGTPAWQIAGIRSCDTLTRVGQAGYIKTQDGDLRTVTLAGRGDS